MKTRISLHIAALVAALATVAALLPGLASAQIVELGQTTTPVTAPTCVPGQPLSDCKILLIHTTAVEATSDAVINPTRVNQEGWLVAFTVGLSRLSSNRRTEATLIKDEDQAYGAPELALTVLAPGPDNTFTVAGESPLYPLTPFLGQVLQQPLSGSPSFTTFTALRVERGDVIGITVPTWAPVLSYDLSRSQFAYRQSRRSGCGSPASGQTAQTRTGSSAPYGCYYTGTRVEYSATEIVDTRAPATYVGQSRRGGHVRAASRRARRGHGAPLLGSVVLSSR